jgi:hypothetical protein
LDSLTPSLGDGSTGHNLVRTEAFPLLEAAKPAAMSGSGRSYLISIQEDVATYKRIDIIRRARDREQWAFLRIIW